MAFSQGSRAGLAFVKEPAGLYVPTLPAPVTLQMLNTATHNLGPVVDYIPNPVLRPDRQRSAPNPGNHSATGSITGPLHWQGYDGLLEGLFCSTWNANTLTNGVVRQTYAFERSQSDNGFYGLGRYMFLNQMGITFAAGSNVDCSFDLIGRSFTWANASVQTTGQPTPAVTANSLMKPGLGVVREGGQQIALVTSCTLTFNNNADPNYVYGSDFMPDFSMGDFSVTGTLTMYWPDRTIISKFIDKVQSSLEIEANDGVRKYTFSLPRITYTGGDAPITSAGSITIDMPFEATIDPVTGYTARITRV